MSRHVVAYVLMLVVVSPFLATFVTAQTAPGQEEQVAQANRFLSAEVQRQIRDMKDEVTTDLKNYQDENFRALDGRVESMLTDVRWQVFIGSIGAVFVASAIVTLILIRTMKTYSYQPAEQVKERPADESPAAAYQDGQSVDQLRNPQWEMQPDPRGMGVEYGQQFASQASDMNSWQAQPAYDGAWKAPIDTKKETGFSQRYPQPPRQQWEGQQWTANQQNQQQPEDYYDDYENQGWEQ